MRKTAKPHLNLELLGEQIGELLKSLRKESGLTLKEVSHHLNQKSLNALSEYERGKRIPNLETLYTLSDLYNTEIAKLLPPTSTFRRRKEIIRTEYSSLARKALEEALKE